MEQIRIYLEGLFSSVNESSEAYDLKNDLYDHLIEKVDDYKSQGMKESEAIGLVLSSIGSMDDLIKEFGLKVNDQDVSSYVEEKNKARKKAALLISLGVSALIFSPVYVIVTALNGVENYAAGMIWLFSLIAVGVGLIIMGGSITERFKLRKKKSTMSPRHKQIESGMYVLATVIFMLLGFLYGLWYIAWVVYLLAYVVLQFMGISEME